MDLIKYIKLNKNTLTLVDLRKVFIRLIINYTFKFKNTKVFITLRAYSNNRTSVKANITSSGTTFYLCLYKRIDLKKKY
jgi:hypothetical protein